MAASTTFVKAKTIMAMKLESTSGTAETVADADFDIKFFDIGVSPEIETYAQEFASGRHSKGRAAMGKRKVTFTAKAQLLTSAAVGTEPKIGKALKACGLAVTTPSSTQTYKPDPTKDEGNSVTATIKVMMVPTSGNAVIITGKGCLGNCVISMDALGSPLVAAFTFTGAFVSITDGTALLLTSPNTGNAPATLGGAITLATVARQVSKFSLDFGNTIELDQDPADATGYAAAYISKRAPKLMLTSKMKKLADDAAYTRWAAGTELAFSLATVVNSQNLRYTISAPVAQYTALPFGNNGEEWARNETYELHESSGGDEFSIVMGA